MIRLNKNQSEFNFQREMSLKEKHFILKEFTILFEPFHKLYQEDDVIFLQFENTRLKPHKAEKILIKILQFL